MLPVPLLPLRGTAAAMLGIMNLRGQVLPVMDLGLHLGAAAAEDDAQTRIPQLAQGQSLRPESVTASGHETRPPARYTEPSLVAKLEELEIGRPSTYASIIRTITSRDYVFKKGSAL